MVVTSRTVRLGATALALGLVLAAASRAEEDQEEGATSEPLVLESYDVRDLVCVRDPPAPRSWMPLPPGPMSGEFSKVFGGAPQQPDVPEALDFDELRQIITRMVNYMSDRGVAAWADEGGPAAIECMPGVLIITQTAHVHQRLKHLLGTMREQRGPLRTVVVHARWVLLDPAKAAELANGPMTTARLPIEVTDEALQMAGAAVAYQAQVTCLNGRAASATSGRAQAYVQEVEVTSVPNTATANATIGVGFSGAVLQVRPTILPNQGAVLLEVCAEVTEVVNVRTVPVPHLVRGADGDKPVHTEVQLPEVAAHALRTSVVVPLGKTVLLGGMTAPNAKKGEVLCLVLKVAATK